MSVPWVKGVPLQHVGSAHLLPQLLKEGVVMEAVVEVILHAPDHPFLPTYHFSFKVLKTLYIISVFTFIHFLNPPPFNDDLFVGTYVYALTPS